jgi:hypothetical protein
MEPPPAGAAGIQVEDNLLGRLAVRIEKQVDQQPLDPSSRSIKGGSCAILR